MRVRRYDSITVVTKETERQDVYWINLANDGGKWLAHVKAVMNLLFRLNERNFLIGCELIASREEL
jgi:hypothetical protein